ncbi:MAG TPA: hypothetical protein VFU29_04320 [Chitinophagaceae bacterium]|nr:hypothetical protein [Chitinophagaceae bacterium]
MKNRRLIKRILKIFCAAFFYMQVHAGGNAAEGTRVIIVKVGIENQRISAEWEAAITSRMDKDRIDSFAKIKRKLTDEEAEWEKLIASKLTEWNNYRDSLTVPFQNIMLPDTIFVLLGFLGDDDAFTFEKQTLCLDLTALYRVYGKAGIEENSSRINRIFAHEYTHLLHKEWARKTGYISKTFMDEILWECLYEGIGMYRSLNPRWLPVNDTLPTVTQTALNELYPVFTERMVTIKKNVALSDIEKQRLNANLSRGNVNKKWGALPVAIWLSCEANGDEKKLVKWIDKGPQAVIELAKKYLPADNKKKFSAVF